MPEPRALSVVPETRTGCYSWRTLWPSEALQRHGFVADYVPFKEYREVALPRMLSGDYNVVLTPRLAWKERWMQPVFSRVLDRAHLAWVYELDDDLFSDAIIERTYQYNIAVDDDDGGMDPEERAIRLRFYARYARAARIGVLPLVDLIVVSTPALIDIVREYTDRPIRVVPNAIDVDWFSERMKLDQPRQVEGLTVGWSGGWRPRDDTRVLDIVWPRLARRYPHVKFLLCGWHPPDLCAAMPADQLVTVEWQTLDDYPFAIRNIDIACCVVADHAWNRCKTPIKWIEASIAGSAVVASHALYGNVATDGYDALLATTVEEWEEHLSRLIESAELRHHIQSTAEQTVLATHTVEQSWLLWRDALAEGLALSPRAQEVVSA